MLPQKEPGKLPSGLNGRFGRLNGQSAFSLDFFPGDDKQDCKNGAKKAGNRKIIETAAEV